MARKKVKPNSVSSEPSASANHRVEKGFVPEPSVPAASLVAVAEPTAEKSTRGSKKTAKKVAEPIEKAELVEKTVEPVPKKTVKEPTAEKPVKMKRLTLDIAKPLHKAIKAKAVEEGIPMVDMLRSLLEKYYGKN